MSYCRSVVGHVGSDLPVFHMHLSVIMSVRRVCCCGFVCVCVCAVFSAEDEGRRVGGKLASLISCLIDCEKFEDDILRKRGGRGAA